MEKTFYIHNTIDLTKPRPVIDSGPGCFKKQIMKAIWKYSIQISDSIIVDMPEGAEILTVQTQNNIACIWAKVDDNKVMVQRHLQMIGTGHDITDRKIGKYIGTFQIEGGVLVFHLFDLGEL